MNETANATKLHCILIAIFVAVNFLICDLSDVYLNLTKHSRRGFGKVQSGAP